MRHHISGAEFYSREEGRARRKKKTPNQIQDGWKRNWEVPKSQPIWRQQLTENERTHSQQVQHPTPLPQLSQQLPSHSTNQVLPSIETSLVVHSRVSALLIFEISHQVLLF